jgi:hypothetical protein
MIKEGVFFRCRIKKSMSDRNFDEFWAESQNTGREELELFDNNYMGKHKVPNYKQFVQQMLKPAE